MVFRVVTKRSDLTQWGFMSPRHCARLLKQYTTSRMVKQVWWHYSLTRPSWRTWHGAFVASNPQKQIHRNTCLKCIKWKNRHSLRYTNKYCIGARSNGTARVQTCLTELIESKLAPAPCTSWCSGVCHRAPEQLWSSRPSSFPSQTPQQPVLYYTVSILPHPFISHPTAVHILTW